MKYSVVCMYDKMTKIYQQPTFYRNFDVAQIQIKRQILDNINNEKLSKEAAKDFKFVQVAIFDDEKGTFEYDEVRREFNAWNEDENEV